MKNLITSTIEKIKKLIRHYSNKQLYKISTKLGFVIVTEDHSLLNSNKEIIFFIIDDFLAFKC